MIVSFRRVVRSVDAHRSDSPRPAPAPPPEVPGSGANRIPGTGRVTPPAAVAARPDAPPRHPRVPAAT